ncbi:hypothetical protein IAD21_00014 [Abditibacteriota bacterium]|nr:hypothetical protein IAD21_00014 [Abditibacteriota bacterium]
MCLKEIAIRRKPIVKRVAGYRGSVVRPKFDALPASTSRLNFSHSRGNSNEGNVPVKEAEDMAEAVWVADIPDGIPEAQERLAETKSGCESGLPQGKRMRIEV